jgi:Flp pilus assembly protein TadD
MSARWLLLTPLLLALTSMSLAQQWFAVHTEHMISYSESSDRGAREVAVRGEQLIAVYGEVFHRKDIAFSTPLRVRAIHLANGAPERAALVRTPAANFVMVDPSQPESWVEAAKSIVALTLEDNYPRAQPWFDTGIENYLAGVRFNGDQMEVGALPLGMALPQSGEWIPLAKLFETHELSSLSPAQRKSFEVESWAVVRWLIDSSRLAQAGAYLNAVQSRGATPERALVEAFSMDAADLDREVRESLGKISTKKIPAQHIESSMLQSQKVTAVDEHVLEANLTLFGPEGDRTLAELTDFMRKNQENAAVHRALAWAFLLRNDLENSVEHIRRALALDDSDPTMHYLYARSVNQGQENKIVVESAESRMSTELKAALKRDPNYAAALELLGLAELSSGSVKPALARFQRASALRPRSLPYYLNLARAYEANSNPDTARNLILYARSGGDPAIRTEAETMLSELGKEKKRQDRWGAVGLHPDATASAKHSKYDNLDEAIAEEEKTELKTKPPKLQQQDTRKVEYLKGRIVSTDCGQAPGAILVVNSAGHNWRMRVDDRYAIVLIGVDHFDCGWQNTSVSINYKRSGNFQGDLVSLETD